MAKYIGRRLLAIFPMLLGISLVTFIIVNIAPGDPVSMMGQMNRKSSAGYRARLRKAYDLDKPVLVRYCKWAGKLVRGDFGRSFRDGRQVLSFKSYRAFRDSKIGRALPVTLGINLLSLMLVLLIAIPLGVVSAARRGSFFDRATTFVVFTGYALPTFWIALILIDFLGVRLGWLPISGLTDPGWDQMAWPARIGNLAQHLVLPVFLSAFLSLAGLSRYTRSSVLEAMVQDYIRAARARGLSERKVLFNHALRNALLPIVTILGLSLPGLIGGSVIFEQIFGIPGMGRLFFTAAMTRDYPLVMGIFTLSAGLVLVANLLSDILYAVVDPRVRYG